MLLFKLFVMAVVCAMLKTLRLMLCLSLLPCFTAALMATAAASPTTNTVLASASNNADKWYRDSAERQALYREVFLMADNVIRKRLVAEHLKPHQ